MGGCIGSQGNKGQSVIVRITKLKHQVVFRMQKLRAEAFAQQKLLLAQLKKPKSYRALAAQKAMASSIVMKINKIHIYQIVRCHIQKIIDYKVHVNDPVKAKQSLYPSFGQILYSQSILKDPNVDFLCGDIKKRFIDVRQASDQQIDDEIMKHHKKEQIPTVSMTNDYFLKLVNQESLNLEQINKIGHNIRFGV